MKQKTKNSEHPKESAGRLMVRNVPTVNEKAKIADVEELLLDKTDQFETINYIYVVSSTGKLQGVISVKEIFRSSKKTFVKNLMKKKPVAVRTHTDEERAALLAMEHNLKEIPVVDKKNTFLGVITYDTLLQILHAEGVENVMRLGGVMNNKYDNIFNLTLFNSIKHRLPWLVIGLLGGLATAGIVSIFEDILSQNLLLAAFIPLIVYMSSAVGTQMEAFIIRDMALNPDLKLGPYLLRQTFVVLMVGLILSVLLYLISHLLYGNLQVSLILMSGLFCAILSSLITGLLVPYMFGKFKLDPANASGPIATIIQDVLSIVIYFSIASLILI